jgi:hypothetical protein
VDVRKKAGHQQRSGHKCHRDNAVSKQALVRLPSATAQDYPPRPEIAGSRQSVNSRRKFALFHFHSKGHLEP